MKTLDDFLNGNLLGDSNIRLWKSKYGNYYYYKQTAKDKIFLEWQKKSLDKSNFHSYILVDNKTTGCFALGFYINNCPYPDLMHLREKWYVERKGEHAQKIVPQDLRLTPTVLLHWYLGDGSLPRRRNDKNRIPAIVLATNTFTKDDIEFLICKLKELDLSFYPVKYKSGFTGKECGYCMYSRTEDGTPFKFFKLIGECPREIADYTTGSKGPCSKMHYFKDKWPNEDDWIKIISNVSGIGKAIKERRLEKRMTRKELTESIKVGKDYLRRIENNRRFPSVEKLKKIMKILDMNAKLAKEMMI
jgi:hypothetical protein